MAVLASDNLLSVNAYHHTDTQTHTDTHRDIDLPVTRGHR